MKRGVVVLVCVCGLAFSQQALAWGAKGHSYVGAIADKRLAGTHAGVQVQQILGYDLATAAPWADCIRSVKKSEDGSFKFVEDPNHPEYTASCTAFETPDETARMEDYAKRNWDNCTYLTGHGCHESYHFADVDEHHDRYDRSYAGTNGHDIVSAIDAAVAVLKGGNAPAPFSIKDKKEALLMIAHFVGDLHQPLHVGAIYLKPSGAVVNADEPGVDASADSTRGGNSILDGARNLHSEWDEIPASLGTTPANEILVAATAIPATAGTADDFAATWAGDTVLASHKAFAGLSFRAARGHGWKAVFAHRSAYIAQREALQTVQLEKAGAHLAELLENIWP